MSILTEIEYPRMYSRFVQILRFDIDECDEPALVYHPTYNQRTYAAHRKSEFISTTKRIIGELQQTSEYTRTVAYIVETECRDSAEKDHPLEWWVLYQGEMFRGELLGGNPVVQICNIRQARRYADALRGVK